MRASERYDVLIVGSGLAGSILALTLSRVGCRTLVIEKGAHPRFAIGESTVPTTTLWMRKLGKRYGVPELGEVCHYLGLKKHGLTAYPKRHFWFGLHHEGRELADDEQLVFDTIRPPVGPDVHMLRADFDAFLVSRLSKYGVEYCDRTELIDFTHEGPGENAVLLRTPEGERAVRARIVVDASGHASFFAHRFGLRESPPRLRTNTRSIFGHFRHVRPLEDALGYRPHPFRHRRDGGTVHHCFHGGWIWVIPFDNGITSVGLELDNSLHPVHPEVPAEEELRAVIARYPSIEAHLGLMEPVRPLVRAGRVQFSCSKVVGDGFVLTPHAAAFIEPLFSSGLLLTLSFINRFVPLAERAIKDGDFSAERFRPLEPTFFQEVDLIDQTVSGTIASFRDFQVFKQFVRTFIHGTAVHFFASAALSGEQIIEQPMLYGASDASFRATVAAMHAVVTDTSLPAAEAAQRLRELIEKVPHPFRAERYDPPPGQGVYLDTRANPLHVARWVLGFYRQPELRGRVPYLRIFPFLLDVLGAGAGRPRLWLQSLVSRLRGGGFHTWLEAIRESERRPVLPSVTAAPGPALRVDPAQPVAPQHAPPLEAARPDAREVRSRDAV